MTSGVHGAEAWKPLPGFDGWYEVSSLGRMRSYRNHNGGRRETPKIMQGQHDIGGYLCYTVRVTASRYKVAKAHVSVMLAFVGPRPKGMDVAHLNGNKSDNRLENLAYCSRRENLEHMHDHGTAAVGARHPKAKLNPDQVNEIRRLRREWVGLRELGRRFGVSHGAIRRAVLGLTWNERSMAAKAK